MKRNSKKYRKIWEKDYGPIPKDSKGRSYEIHHIDGNCNNNNLKNLLCLSIDEHYDIHFKQGDLEACHAIELRRSNTPLIGWKRSKQTLEKIKKSKEGYKHSPEVRQKMSESRVGKKHTIETLKKLSQTHSEPIKHILTGVVYSSGLEAARINCVSQSTISLYLKKGVFKKINMHEFKKNRSNNNKKCLSKGKGGMTQKKRIKHIATGIVYESVAEAAKVHNKYRNNMSSYVRSGIFELV